MTFSSQPYGTTEVGVYDPTAETAGLIPVPIVFVENPYYQTFGLLEDIRIVIWCWPNTLKETGHHAVAAGSNSLKMLDFHSQDDDENYSDENRFQESYLLEKVSP
jgi:hypothetical protein